MMARSSTFKVPSLVEKMWDLRKAQQVKQLVLPSVRWLFLWTQTKRKDQALLKMIGSHPPFLTKLVIGSVAHQSRLQVSTCSPFQQSSAVQQPGSLPDIQDDPYKLTQDVLTELFSDIRKELWVPMEHLRQISRYYFDGNGKIFRPMLIALVSRAVNYHTHDTREVLKSQREIALVAEMIHTASLVHDDVIDTSDTRRGKASVNLLWGQNKAILAGDFILSKAGRILARIGNEEVVIMLTQVLLDLVQGELMQLGSKEDAGERFSHYLQKTFMKTASLMAYTCKAVAYLGGADKTLLEGAFQYGRNLGIAFQLVDDLLDFVSSQDEMGKPAAADLKLGLATSPVLFACEKFPELNTLIMRRFSHPGDVEQAYEAVMKSEGLEQTKLLAQKHCNEALRHIDSWRESPEKQALVTIMNKVLNRKK